jgi:hypothetical protein
MLLVDVSDSALSCWSETKKATFELADLLGPDYEVQLSILGQSQSLARAAFESLGNPASFRHNSCTLVGPQIYHAVSDGTFYSLVAVIGSGLIFDLLDWLSNAGVANWLLVQTGDEPLAKEEWQVPTLHYATQPLSMVHQLLLQNSPSPTISSSQLRASWGQSNYNWRPDKIGYPMVWVPEIEAYVHLFSVTKVQFEQYLSQSGNSEQGDEWYSQLLELNPRGSATNHQFEQYEQMLLCGLMPQEAQAYARWNGPNYSLMTDKEWIAAYHRFDQVKSDSLPDGLLHPAVRQLANIIQHMPSINSLMDLSLMQSGCLDWVEKPDNPNRKFAALGKTRPHFSSLRLRSPLDLFYATGNQPRLPYIGVRLKMREY